MKVPRPPHHDSAPLPLGPYVEARIIDQLRQALALASANLAGRLDRLRDLLQDVTTRLDAVMLVRAALPPRSRLVATALATAGGEPAREFLLIPFGEVTVERPIAGESFVFTPNHAASAHRWFERMGRKLAIDYEHQTFDRCNTRSDGLRPAAGWIGGLEVRADGLWAVEVTWTARAGELLRSGEYRYYSPVIFWTDEDHTDVAALGPVALTNDPAMHGVQPLAAGGAATLHTHTDESSPDRHTDTAPTEEALPQEPTTTPEAVAPSAITAVELHAAQSEIRRLRAQLAAQEADTFVERGLRLGKITEGTSMDWRADFLRDPAATEARLSRAPVILPPGRVLAVDEHGRVTPRVPQAEARIGNFHDLTDEDLAAFERAAAAGRVAGAAF